MQVSLDGTQKLKHLDLVRIIKRVCLRSFLVVDQSSAAVEMPTARAGHLQHKSPKRSAADPSPGPAPSSSPPSADPAWGPSPDAPINTQIPHDDDDGGDSAFLMVEGEERETLGLACVAARLAWSSSVLSTASLSESIFDYRSIHGRTSPVDHPKRVLDVGTATGIWAIDMADPAPLEWTCRPEILDFVHLRALYGSISDWGELYRQVFRALEPGGWLEDFELRIHLHSDAPEERDNPEHIFKRWQRSFGRAVPLGSWSSDPKMKQIGAYNLAFLDESLEGFALFILKEIMGWKHEEVQLFVMEMPSRTPAFARTISCESPMPCFPALACLKTELVAAGQTRTAKGRCSRATREEGCVRREGGDC
ncbi:hypothetical protein ACCO45_007870 [Purpureocillium lilacinum]|uniref:Uncharacterized protein n=1 Tax=Purpureocillium lilacinum TaxID=33203 RepID=A0ACC4DLN5_PURLI